jgi:hypothetical protein
MPPDTHYCAHCTHVRYAVDAESSDRLLFGCAQSHAVTDSPHHCEDWEREPGADDDLEWLP